MRLRALRRRLLSYCGDEGGGVTVEFVLWIPILLALVLTAADAALVFTRQSNFWNVSHETARIVSRHALNPDTAADYARAQVTFAGYTPDVSVTVDDAMVVVTISGDSRVMAPFGMLRYVIGERVSSRVTQALEPI